MSGSDDRELIEGTLADIRDSLAGLLQKREGIDREIASKQERLNAWTKRLQKLGNDNGDLGRRPRGENLNTIRGVLKAGPLAAADLQKQTGLAWSSVQGTLKRNRETFVEENGKWRLRDEPTNSASMH